MKGYVDTKRDEFICETCHEVDPRFCSELEGDWYHTDSDGAAEICHDCLCGFSLNLFAKTEPRTNGTMIVLLDRLDALKQAIRDRKWEDVEFQFERVLRCAHDGALLRVKKVRS